MQSLNLPLEKNMEKAGLAVTHFYRSLTEDALSQNGFKVFLWGFYWCNVEFFSQYFKDVWR